MTPKPDTTERIAISLEKIARTLRIISNQLDRTNETLADTREAIGTLCVVVEEASNQ